MNLADCDWVIGSGLQVLVPHFSDMYLLGTVPSRVVVASKHIENTIGLSREQVLGIDVPLLLLKYLFFAVVFVFIAASFGDLDHDGNAGDFGR